jgi:hypothetical protein
MTRKLPLSKYIVSLKLILGGFCLYGQTIPSIQLDRPDQTECPYITPPKYIQNENGFTIENFENNHRFFNYPSMLWKYGVNEKLEVRLITELVSFKSSVNSNSGFLPITVGFKTSLFEEKGLIPKTSFIGHIATSRMGSKEFHTELIAPAFRFTMLHTLSSKMTLSYNIGAEWNGDNSQHVYIYTVTTGFSLTEKIGCYSELYGFISSYKVADHRFDAGFTYLVNNDMIIDFSGGFGLNDNMHKNYVSLGLSYRFNAAMK